MAAKKPAAPLSSKDKAVADRVKRARKSYPTLDRHGGYADLIRELADELGADVVSIFEEWSDRVTAMLYTGDVDIDDAESTALSHVREQYRRAS